MPSHAMTLLRPIEVGAKLVRELATDGDLPKQISDLPGMEIRQKVQRLTLLLLLPIDLLIFFLNQQRLKCLPSSPLCSE